MKKTLLLFLFLFVFLVPQVNAADPDQLRDCNLSDIPLKAGTSTCMQNRVYTCEEPGGSVDDCVSRGEDCWFTDIDKTHAKCFTKAETATACANNGILYKNGESWCNNVQDKITCNNGRPTSGVGDACSLQGGNCSVVSVEPKKEAACIASGTPGCMYFGVFYKVGDYLCTNNRDKVLRCDGTPSGKPAEYTELSTCLNNSCVRNGLQDVYCSVAGEPGGPLDGRAIDNLRKRMSCGGINEACCPLTADLWRQLPAVPQFSIPGVSQAVGFINQVINTLGAPILRSFNNTLVYFQGQRCYEGEEELTGINPVQCMCRDPKTKAIVSLCKDISDSGERRACEDCAAKGIWTAIGCVDYNFTGFVQNIIFGRGIALAGVIAFFCIIQAAFILQTSAGEAQKIKDAQERMTSCIMGLMLIIFSVFILRVIGVNILKIPGFGI